MSVLQKVVIKHFQFSNKEELEHLQQKEQFPKTVVASLLDSAEVAHLQQYNQSSYLVLNFPHSTCTPYNRVTRPIAAFIRKNEVLFITPQEIALEDFLDTKKMSNLKSTGEVISRFFLHMLSQFSAALAKNTKTIALGEKQLFQNPKNETIEQLLHIQKSLISYKVAIVGFRNILDTIKEQHPPLLWDADHEIDYSNISIETSQVETTIAVTSELISSVLDVSNSVFANNLSRTMQTLTSITLVLSIPTLVASIYGMNIELPLQNHPQALLIVTLTTVVLTIGVAVYLYKRRWF